MAEKKEKIVIQKINTDDSLPVSFAPMRQLGLKVAMGLPGFPANRMILTYGPPSGGKSTLAFQTAGEYIFNGDEVWFANTEQAVDKIYMASYFPMENTPEFKIDALKHLAKETEKTLKADQKEKADGGTISAEKMAIMQKRLESIPILIKEIKDDKDVKTSALGRNVAYSIQKYATSMYRLRNVEFLTVTTMEEFEKDIIKRMEKKMLDPDRKHKRLLIVVDSINYLMPEEVLERAVCSEGSNFVTAKYLHALLPKLITRLAGTDTSLFFIYQQNKTIKMNPYERTSKIEDVTVKGGTAGKFGATHMIGVERRGEVQDCKENSVPSGRIDIAKSKLRGGGNAALSGTFYLKEDLEYSIMDFTEPLLRECFQEEQYGLRKYRGDRKFIPIEFLVNHPEFDTKIQPKMRKFPKEEETGEQFYYEPDSEEEAIRLLTNSREFEEEIFFQLKILTNI
jgi:RecA/RadA recombinase